MTTDRWHYCAACDRMVYGNLCGCPPDAPRHAAVDREPDTAFMHEIMGDGAR